MTLIGTSNSAKIAARLLAVGCIASVFGATAWLASPDHSAAGPITHDSLGERNPQFWIGENTGSRGDVVLNVVDFGGGLRYESFIYADRITDFSYSGDKFGMRIIAGPDTATDAEAVSLCGLDDDWSSVSPDDMDLFNAHCTAAFQNANLNHYISLDKHNAEFSLIVEFGREIRDNNAEDDPIPELLYFERGPSAGNSSLTVEAVDEEGNTIGNSVVIAPEDGIHTLPSEARVAALRTNASMEYRGEQVMTCVAVDLSALGIERTQRLRLRTPRPGDVHTDGRPFTSGELQPDFKLVAVQTYDVAMPTWVIGD